MSDYRKKLSNKATWAIAAVAAIALIGIAAPLAFADNVGAPTSAAGGLTAPSSPSRSGAAGPLGGTNGSISGSSGGSASGSMHYDYQPLKLAPPGTGKFEGPNNGTTTPCVGSTGFGSSKTQPGHAC